MSTDPLSAEVLDALRELDTPTVCNALEIVAPHRRAYGYTTAPLVCPDPDTVMVGYARTATIRANAPSGRSGEADLAMRVGYYRHMAEGPHPTITVIEDIDASPGYGAWWGEVNSSIHAGLGSLGVVTNGSIRDLGSGRRVSALWPVPSARPTRGCTSWSTRCRSRSTACRCALAT